MSLNKIRVEQTEGILGTIVAGTGISIDNTDPQNPIITNTGSGGGGAVDTIVAGTGITVDATDSANPIVATTITQYTDELSQDAVGGILTNTSSVELAYSDVTPSITATIAALGVTNAMLAGSIAASKLVGTDIATVGTLTSGTLGSGFTTVAVARGGTGATTLTQSALLIGNGTSAISALALGTANQIVGMNAAATANEYKSFALGTTGSDVNFAYSAGTITLHIPDASGTARGLLTISSQSIKGVKTFESYPVGPGTAPTSASEFADKGYVDGLFVGLAVKSPCVVATTANITLSGEQTIDGVSTSASRVLVKNQSTASQNGVYVSAAGAWSRSTDFDVAGEIVPGATFYVSSGTTQTGTLWVQSETVTTVGTDPINFGQVSSPLTYTFAVSQTDNGSNDFSVTQSGVNITYNLPDAGHGVRGALTGADWDMFNAKVGTTGSFTTGQIPKISGTNTITESGWTFSISGGATSSFAIPTSGTGAVIGGTLAQFAATTSAQLAGVISDETGSGALVFGTSPTLVTPNLGTPSTLVLTNATGLPLTTGVTGVLPVANGGFNAVDVQIFTADGTWNKPTGAMSVSITMLGGGGGGGSGRKGATGTARSGGGGGAGGGWGQITFPASILGSSESVTVGTGGSGGVSQTTSTTNGNAGVAGGNTSFGTWLRVLGGARGNGGTTSATGNASGGSGFPSVGGYTVGGQGGTTNPSSGVASATPATTAMTGGGGGGGGSITSGNTASPGGLGGAVGTSITSGYGTQISGGTSGATSTTGGSGNASPTNSAVGGSGGGGGGASTTTNAGAGGAGAPYGAGGGGGGAATNSVGDSGAGGDGADGIVIVITYF